MRAIPFAGRSNEPACSAGLLVETGRDWSTGEEDDLDWIPLMMNEHLPPVMRLDDWILFCFL